MNCYKPLLVLVFLPLLISCRSSRKENESLKLFNDYYAVMKKDSDDKWNYTADTVKVWFDDKSGNPILQIKGKRSIGAWKEWDEVMNSRSHYDSLWFDKEENAVKGYFFENNDFYELIGKSPTKTLQTYWINSDNKINEILIYWIPEENTTTDIHLKPIIEWAIKFDSTEIKQLYPNNRIIPSKENALRWKKLLNRYHEFKDTSGASIK